MTTTTPTKQLSRIHFTALLSMIMALSALAIDLMLPAFGDIRAHFDLAPDSGRVAQIVTAYLLGLALGQYFYGPLADRFGRKPVLYLGFVIYGIAALAAAVAPSLELVLLARFVWGVGGAGPRVVALSIVRDTYSGDEMSKAMSYIMAVFIMVPVLAPSIGAALITVFPWQAVFVFCFVFVVAIAAWTRVLPETLEPENRRPIDMKAIAGATREVLTHRQTIGYATAMSLMFGVFASYLASSERIFSDFYGKESEFPLIFGGISLVIGVAVLANASIVGRVGTKRLTHVVLSAYVVAAALLNLITFMAGGRLGFVPFVLGLLVIVWLHALLIPNFNSIAMEPMGHIAGTASAVLGTLTLLVGSALGAIIDATYTDSATPLIVAFLVFGLPALGAVAWAEHGKLFPPPVDRPPPEVPNRSTLR